VTNKVDISAVTPDRWEGDVTKDLLREILGGLLIPNQAMSCRLAWDLLQRMKQESK
jgi:hypothetical protein